MKKVATAAAGIIVSFVVLLGQHPAAAAGASVRDSQRGTDVQGQLDAALATHPGGVQVSDNAVAWEGGNVILVVPSAGETVTPPGLGSGVRKETLTTPVLQEQAALSGSASRAGAGSCPGGYFETDYYCFYVDRDYGGRRLQFTGNTSSEHASNYGFNNQTSSWVSNDVDCHLQAYDTIHGNRLWQQPENSTSTYVGNANNDKMSYWTCG